MVLYNNQNYTYKKYYKGSQWWCITKELALFFIYESKKNHIEQFKRMHAPDEKFFVTLAMNSKYKNKIRLSYSQASLVQGLHYIDWGGGSKKGLQIFNTSQVEEAKILKCAFARKIDAKKSNDYITYLMEITSHYSFEEKR